jgi:hypothetical protein
MTIINLLTFDKTCTKLVRKVKFYYETLKLRFTLLWQFVWDSELIIWLS